MTDRISPRQFHEAGGVEHWRVLGEGACAYFHTGSFAPGARLVQAIGELAGLDAHHPDVDLRRDGVTVRLLTVTDDYWGLSRRDLELARQISALARKLGLPADPSAVETVQVTIDALVSGEVMPFWRAVLGYEYPRRQPRRGPGRPARPRGVALVPGDGRARPSATGSTSTSGCPTTRPRPGSRPRSPPAAAW